MTRDLHASWRLHDEGRVRGELRRLEAHGQAGDVVGHVIVNWRSLTDSLDEAPLIGRLTGWARSVTDMVGVPDPLGWIEIEVSIDRIVFGHPISRTARAGATPTQWIVHGGMNDWWVSIAIARAGVPTPADFRVS